MGLKFLIFVISKHFCNGIIIQHIYVDLGGLGACSPASTGIGNRSFEIESNAYAIGGKTFDCLKIKLRYVIFKCGARF